MGVVEDLGSSGDDLVAMRSAVAGAADPELADCGFKVLREVAAVGYTGDAYHRAAAAGVSDAGPHTKMIAALWRDSREKSAVAEGSV